VAFLDNYGLYMYTQYSCYFTFMLMFTAGSFWISSW